MRRDDMSEIFSCCFLCVSKPQDIQTLAEMFGFLCVNMKRFLEHKFTALNCVPFILQCLLAVSQRNEFFIQEQDLALAAQPARHTCQGQKSNLESQQYLFQERCSCCQQKCHCATAEKQPG